MRDLKGRVGDFTAVYRRNQMVRLMAFVVLALLLQGCVLTKLVSVPMRLTGAVLSIIPVVGNTAHDGIDEAAEIVDDLPI
jgi:hypothetical protein